jgi:hypothetical protein
VKVEVRMGRVMGGCIAIRAGGRIVVTTDGWTDGQSNVRMCDSSSVPLGCRTDG